MAANENDLLYVTNPTKHAFTVKWGGNPLTIQPNAKITVQRFLAEHFAKHLADFILLREEQRLKKIDGQDHRLLNSRVKRPQVLSTIILGVYSYFTPQSNDPNAIVAQQIAALNAQQDNPNEPRPMDIGSVDDTPSGGVLEDDEDDELSLDDLLKAAGKAAAAPPPAHITAPAQPPAPPADPPTPPISPADPVPPVQPPQHPDGKPKRTREELFAEAKHLGLKPMPNMSNKQIEQMIVKFYG